MKVAAMFSMVWILASVVHLAGQEKREYFHVPVAAMAKNHHTHVEVTGTVTLVKKEADGDTHIRLEDGGAFIVAECIPSLPCKPPQVGDIVAVFGISRFDGEHKWYEVHPIERLQVIPK